MRGCISSSLCVARLSWHVRVASYRPLSSFAPSCQRITISRLLEQAHTIDDVQISGWVRTVRKQKRVAFLALGDGSAFQPLQAVLTPEQSEGLAQGTAVELRGNWIRSTGKGQSNELQVSSITIGGENDAENNPIQPKYQSLEYLRTVPHLRPRLSVNSLLLRLRSEVIASLTKWFHDQGFVQCHTPIITSSDCEGAGEVFTVTTGTAAASEVAQPFFKSPKYLTVSAQLHLEALSLAVDKVWTLSPTFRAEKSDTPRHLSEFYMLEAELCFVKSAAEVMDVVENMLRDTVVDLRRSQLLKELIMSKEKPAKDDNESSVLAGDLERRWNGLAAPAWPRITYDEAIGMLMAASASGEKDFSIKPSYNDGLAAEHERWLANTVGQGSPIFVTRYPAEQKPFYMAPAATGSRSVDLVDCFDLLVPELCELVGGSLREHRSKELLQGMKAKDVSGEALEWYQDLRRYGSVSHGGFGLGFDRLICYLAGVSSIRDVVSFPRYYGKADC